MTDQTAKKRENKVLTKEIGRAKELITKVTSEGLWNNSALKKTNNYRILVVNAIIE